MESQSKVSNIGHATSKALSKPLPVYTHATICGGTVYTSAIQAFIPGTFDFPSADPKIQARQVLKNLKTILEELGSGIEQVLKITLYMTTYRGLTVCW